MQLPFETLTVMGLSASGSYSLVSRLNVLYTPLAWIPHDLGFPHVRRFNCLAV